MDRIQKEIEESIALKRGTVVALTLAAATLTVSTDFRIHSLHSYFLLAGKYDVPIYLHVDRVRDGTFFFAYIETI
ncbi:Acyl-coenzyme A thioesterase 8 [Smittium culicis]|uniref:Acyl-coenzyme A thioesterase 8 n=1 Tax=Smittium culicis TaxID=133412 RepID=A0A1R1YF77_9FUNG|nr:Acyl-coenzyme A thioesterase 8 [Smittium culicis]